MNNERERLAKLLEEMRNGDDFMVMPNDLTKAAALLRNQPAPADDAALIAEAERRVGISVAHPNRQDYMHESLRLAREGWQPPAEPEPDRAAQVWDEANKAYARGRPFGKDEAAISIIRAAMAEAEHPVIDVPDKIQAIIGWYSVKDVAPDDWLYLRDWFTKQLTTSAGVRAKPENG